MRIITRRRLETFVNFGPPTIGIVWIVAWFKYVVPAGSLGDQVTLWGAVTMFAGILLLAVIFLIGSVAVHMTDLHLENRGAC